MLFGPRSRQKQYNGVKCPGCFFCRVQTYYYFVAHGLCKLCSISTPEALLTYQKSLLCTFQLWLAVPPPCPSPLLPVSFFILNPSDFYLWGTFSSSWSLIAPVVISQCVIITLLTFWTLVSLPIKYVKERSLNSWVYESQMRLHKVRSFVNSILCKNVNFMLALSFIFFKSDWACYLDIWTVLFSKLWLFSVSLDSQHFSDDLLDTSNYD